MKTLVNFRDLGKWKTQDGRVIKSNRLLRSGEVVKLDAEDIKSLRDDYQLKMIIDFRTLGEVNERPIDEIEGVEYLHLDVMKDVLTDLPSFEKVAEQINPDMADEYMKGINHHLITTRSAIVGYQQFFRACLANEEGSVLFHCFHGKDRTGFGAALLLKTLGVSDEDIMVDYLKTVEARAEDNRMMLEGFRKRGLSEIQLEGIKSMISVKQAYLEAAFATIEQEYGSFENYLKTGLEITDEEVEQLKANYLEEM